MDKNQIKKTIYSKIDELPTLPAIVPKILSLVENPKTSASDLTNLIQNDPALMSKILKVANSAYYGFSQEIDQLDRAVALLGFKMVKSLALSIGVLTNLPKEKKNPFFSREGLWLHSIAVATLLNEVNKRFGSKNGEEIYFIIGLLHDIGKIVLDHFFYEKFQQVLEVANEDKDIKLHEAEVEIIGIDHCEVSAMLLERWKFPEKIVNVIANHHYHHHHDSSANDRSYIAMLRIANVFAQELALGGEGNDRPNRIHQKDIEILKISEKNMEDMRSYAHDARVDIKALFSSLI